MRIEMLFLRNRSAERLDEELRFHLEQQIAENIAVGMSPEESRQAALRAFGNPAVLRYQARETWSWSGVERVLQDARFALRQIVRSPGFAVIAIVTLALGIGANTAVFTLTHALLLRTLPVRDPGELVRLAIDMSAAESNGHDAPLSLPTIEAIQKQTRTMYDVFGWCVYDLQARLLNRRRLLTENSGYRTDQVVFALTDFLRVPQKGEALVSLYRRMAERISERPGVEQTSVSAISPLMGWRWSDDFIAMDAARHTRPLNAMENLIGGHYFSTLGVSIVAGRDLGDSNADRNSCIVSQAAARTYFPNGLALGKTLRCVIHHRRTGEPDTFRDYQIVGIARDTKYDSLRESPPPIVYLPILSEDNGSTNGGSQLFLVIRAQSVAAANSAYLTTLHEMAPSSPEIPPVAFSQVFRDSVARERLLSILSGFFALLGLLLSCIGIYGLVAWNVTRRTTEIGVRMALGVTRLRVFALVMRPVAGLLAIGVVCGGLGALFAARSIRSFLFEAQPGNPWVFLASAVALVAIGLFAAALPARRAVSIDPIQALRTE
jgi:hypothetical protein